MTASLLGLTTKEMVFCILLALIGLLKCFAEELMTSLIVESQQHRSPEIQSSGSCGSFYGTTSYSSAECAVYICGTGTMTFSSCSDYGGSFTGDPKFYLYDSSYYYYYSSYLAYDDDYCAYGPQITYDLITTACETYYLRATCFSYPCSVTASFSYSGSVVPIVTSSFPSSGSPSLAPTRLPGSNALATFSASYASASLATLSLCGAGTITISSCSAYGGSAYGYSYFYLYDSNGIFTVAFDFSYYCAPGSQITYVKSTSTCDVFYFSSVCYSSTCSTSVAYLFTGSSASVYNYPTTAPVSSPSVGSITATISIIITIVVVILVGIGALVGVCFCIARQKARAVRPQVSFAPPPIVQVSQPANHQQNMAQYTAQQVHVYGVPPSSQPVQQTQPQVAMAQPYKPSDYNYQQPPPPLAEAIQVPVPYSSQPAVMGGTSVPYPSGVQMTTYSSIAPAPMSAPPAAYNFTVDHTNHAAVVIHHEAVTK